MLLADLLEQEKHEKEERERQASMNSEMNNPNSSTLLSEHDFERLLGAQGMPSQGIPAQGLLPIQQQQQSQQQQQQSPQQPQMVQAQQQQRQFVAQNTPRPQFIQRSISQPHQAPQQHMPNQVQDMNVVMEPNIVVKKDVNMQMFVPNIQKAPNQPPDCIVTEQDRQTQIVYEQWLTNKDNELGNHQKYLQDRVDKLRKTRRALNSKQRQLKKGGNDLTKEDNDELNRITIEQTGVQKQLDNARKQSRQHSLLFNEYKNKQQAVTMKNNLARQQMAVSFFIMSFFPHFLIEIFHNQNDEFTLNS